MLIPWTEYQSNKIFFFLKEPNTYYPLRSVWRLVKQYESGYMLANCQQYTLAAVNVAFRLTLPSLLHGAVKTTSSHRFVHPAVFIALISTLFQGMM
jgi:hypothetical protein